MDKSGWISTGIGLLGAAVMWLAPAKKKWIGHILFGVSIGMIIYGLLSEKSRLALPSASRVETKISGRNNSIGSVGQKGGQTLNAPSSLVATQGQQGNVTLNVNPTDGSPEERLRTLCEAMEDFVNTGWPGSKDPVTNFRDAFRSPTNAILISIRMKGINASVEQQYCEEADNQEKILTCVVMLKSLSKRIRP